MISFAYEITLYGAPKRKRILWPCQETVVGVVTFARWFMERPMVVGEFDDLTAGENARIDVADGLPQTVTYLVYSIIGEGSTYVPALNISLDLVLPRQAGPPMVTDDDGFARWDISIPKDTIGRTVWFQAAQYENVSNVAEEVIGY